LRAPDFWWLPRPTPKARLLSAVSLFWSLGAALRRLLHRPARGPVPVVSVGNLVAGGAGKTPVAMAVMERLGAFGLNAHVIGTGYGGSIGWPYRVQARQDGVHQVGDEALLHAARWPTWIGRSRLRAARAAAAEGAVVVVLDDGHQQRSLAPDLSFVVVDAEVGFGNGLLMPAGPLREGVAAGLARADAIVLLGEGEGPPLPVAKPVLRARLLPEPASLRFKGERVVAFAGIGRPAKFFGTLAAAGADLRHSAAFPDHHRYKADEIMLLVETASSERAVLVTTAKDWVRLPRAARGMVEVFTVHCAFEDPAALDALLRRACGA